MKTARQLSEEIGVSKTAIFNKIDSLGLRPDLIEKGNRLLIPDNVSKAIWKEFKGTSEDNTEAETTTNDKENEKLLEEVEKLKIQLEGTEKQVSIYEKQVDNLQQQNEKLVSLLEQAQNNVKMSQILQSKAEGRVLELEANEPDWNEPEEKKSFWKRIFK